MHSDSYDYDWWSDDPKWYGRYWSSVPSSDSRYAWNLYFYSGRHYTGYDYGGRYYGLPVRPVQGFTN